MSTITIKSNLINNPGAMQILAETIKARLPSALDFNIEVSSTDKQGEVQITVDGTYAIDGVYTAPKPGSLSE